MAENSKIEWTDHTFNPWEGCQKVGPGCDHCYAETRNARFGGGVAVNWGPGAPRRRTSVANWQQPLKWNRLSEQWVRNGGQRARVFCASLADVFDNQVPDAWRLDLFRLIRATPHLDWLLLTKRIGNARIMLANVRLQADEYLDQFPWPNVWIGATVVNQEEADRDIPKLLAVPAAVRFLSMEPLLGPVDITPFLWGKNEAVDTICQNCPRDADCECGYHTRTALMMPALHWVIAGGESGPGARPMHTDWARNLRGQCAAAGVPFLFKQWGEWLGAMQDGDNGGSALETNATDHPIRIGKKAAGRFLDGQTHDGFPEPR